MKKATFDKNVATVKADTKAALQTMYDALNQGQQKQNVKNAEVKALFDRYGVEY
jgi:outer membrane protein OmpA-like peptidoglycan-associated protein